MNDPIAWAYEYHEFGDVWKRHVILNRPGGGANPPTKHHGSDVRNVSPLYTEDQIHTTIESRRRHFPGGWRLVPIKPTKEMILAGKHTIKGCFTTFESIIADMVYQSMLNNAPNCK